MRRSDDSPPITPESPPAETEPVDQSVPTEQAESTAPIETTPPPEAAAPTDPAEPATPPTPPEPESIAASSSEPASTTVPSVAAPEETTTPAEGNPPPESPVPLEFIHLPLGRIIVEEQIRTGIDTKGESFQSLMESIRQKGVLEPVLVAPRDERFLLISGERRFLACRQLGLETIPSRVLDAVVSQDEILAIQLIENLQRENLNPIDEANAYFAFFRGSQTGLELDGIINTIMNYSRDPERVKSEFTAKFAVIGEY